MLKVNTNWLKLRQTWSIMTSICWLMIVSLWCSITGAHNKILPHLSFYLLLHTALHPLSLLTDIAFSLIGLICAQQHLSNFRPLNLSHWLSGMIVIKNSHQLDCLWINTLIEQVAVHTDWWLVHSTSHIFSLMNYSPGWPGPTGKSKTVDRFDGYAIICILGERRRVVSNFWVNRWIAVSGYFESLSHFLTSILWQYPVITIQHTHNVSLNG